MEKTLSNEEYETLISKTFEGTKVKEKTIVSGKIVSLENDLVTIDVGSKSEGRIPVSEFHRPGQKPEMNIGDSYDVFIENVDNANGETIFPETMVFSFTFVPSKVFDIRASYSSFDNFFDNVFSIS